MNRRMFMGMGAGAAVMALTPESLVSGLTPAPRLNLNSTVVKNFITEHNGFLYNAHRGGANATDLRILAHSAILLEEELAPHILAVNNHYRDVRTTVETANIQYVNPQNLLSLAHRQGVRAASDMDAARVVSGKIFEPTAEARSYLLNDGSSTLLKQYAGDVNSFAEYIGSGLIHQTGNGIELLHPAPSVYRASCAIYGVAAAGAGLLAGVGLFCPECDIVIGIVSIGGLGIEVSMAGIAATMSFVYGIQEAMC